MSACVRVCVRACVREEGEWEEGGMEGEGAYLTDWIGAIGGSIAD